MNNKQNILKKVLMPYMIPHPTSALNNTFTPKKRFCIKFRLTNGVIIKGKHEDLEISFDESELSAFEIECSKVTIKASWEEIIAIEISSDKDQDKAFNLLHIEPERRN